MTSALFTGWRGRKVQANDGQVGSVHDFYFDDASWGVRYLVLDVGRWMRTDRRLIDAGALRPTVSAERGVVVDGCREALRHGPPVEAHQPVSAQKLAERRRLQDLRWFVDTGLTTSGEQLHSTYDLQGDATPGDLHLQSCHALVGYSATARHGRVGQITDLLIDASRWVVTHAVVRAGRVPRRSWILPVQLVTLIDCESRTIEFAADRASFVDAPANSPIEGQDS